jgi:hypothetical protein
VKEKVEKVEKAEKVKKVGWGVEGGVRAIVEEGV